MHHVAGVAPVDQVVGDHDVDLAGSPPGLARGLLLGLLEAELLHIDVARRGTEQVEGAGAASAACCRSRTAGRDLVPAPQEMVRELLAAPAAGEVGPDRPKPLGAGPGDVTPKGDEAVGQVGPDVGHADQGIDVGEADPAAAGGRGRGGGS